MNELLNSLTENLALISVVIAFLILVTAIITLILKIIKRNMNPIITDTKIYYDPKMNMGIVEIEITNHANHNIVLKKILYKEKSFLSLFKPNQKVILQTKLGEDEHGIPFLVDSEKITLSIANQKRFFFCINSFNPKATYKIYVKTSEGGSNRYLDRLDEALLKYYRLS